MAAKRTAGRPAQSGAEKAWRSEFRERLRGHVHRKFGTIYSAKMGKSRKTLELWLRKSATGVPSSWELRDLARLLGVTTDELLFGPSSVQNPPIHLLGPVIIAYTDQWLRRRQAALDARQAVTALVVSDPQGILDRDLEALLDSVGRQAEIKGLRTENALLRRMARRKAA